MSELPFFNTTSETRRRHNNINNTATETVLEGASTANAKLSLHSHSVNNLTKIVEHSTPIINQLNSSSSFKTLSSFIVPASNFWSVAQVIFCLLL